MNVRARSSPRRAPISRLPLRLGFVGAAIASWPQLAPSGLSATGCPSTVTTRPVQDAGLSWRSLASTVTVAASSSPMIRWSVDGASVRCSAVAATSGITASVRFSSTSTGSGATSTAVAVRCSVPLPSLLRRLDQESLLARRAAAERVDHARRGPQRRRARRNRLPARGHAERRHLAEAADLQLRSADDQHLCERRRLQIDGGLARAPERIGGARDAVAHAGRHDDRDGHVALGVGAHRAEDLGSRSAPRPTRWRWCGTASAPRRRAAGSVVARRCCPPPARSIDDDRRLREARAGRDIAGDEAVVAGRRHRRDRADAGHRALGRERYAALVVAHLDLQRHLGLVTQHQAGSRRRDDRVDVRRRRGRGAIELPRAQQRHRQQARLPS